MPDNEETRRRMAALEAENARLRQQLQTQAPTAKQTTTYVTMWKGHPVIRFEGNFRPFALGLKKASIVLETIDDVRHFVENNRQHLSNAPDEVE